MSSQVTEVRDLFPYGIGQLKLVLGQLKLILGQWGPTVASRVSGESPATVCFSFLPLLFSRSLASLSVSWPRSFRINLGPSGTKASRARSGLLFPFLCLTCPSCWSFSLPWACGWFLLFFSISVWLVTDWSLLGLGWVRRRCILLG